MQPTRSAANAVGIARTIPCVSEIIKIKVLNLSFLLISAEEMDSSDATPPKRRRDEGIPVGGILDYGYLF